MNQPFYLPSSYRPKNPVIALKKLTPLYNEKWPTVAVIARVSEGGVRELRGGALRLADEVGGVGGLHGEGADGATHPTLTFS